MKKIISLITAVVIFIQALPVLATGEYYSHKDFRPVTAEDLVYKKTSTDALKKNISEINTAIKSDGNDIKVAELLEQVFYDYAVLQDSYALAYLAYDRNMTEENKSDTAYAMQMCTEAMSLITDIVYDIYESDYRIVLDVMFGSAEAALEVVLPDDGEAAELIKKEEELSNKYGDVCTDSDKAAELFLELLEIRRQIAEKFGYDSYSTYADENIYGRSFTDEELAEFSQAVKDYIYPLLYSGGTALGTILPLPLSMTEDDVLLTARRGIGEVSGELLETYDYMIANNLYDIRVSDKKNIGAGAYTIGIATEDFAFLFDNPMFDYADDGCSSVRTVVHEFGHFSAMVNDPAANDIMARVLNVPSIETAEIQSQGLEMLVEHSYGRMFGSEASYERYLLLVNIASAVLEGCMFDQWQREVYSLDKPTKAELNELAQRLLYEYMDFECTLEEAQDIWVSVPHNFIQPMYYISYALSAMVALNLYRESISSLPNAVDKYMQISAEGMYKDFDELLEDYGYEYILNAEAVKSLVHVLNGYYGFGYSDISEDAWYHEYIYTVSNVIDARYEKLFCPDNAITRSEFVGAIGKMYDYYVGIDEEYESSFKDIDGDKYAEYIAWAEANGIVDGYDAMTFDGGGRLTREQAAAIIYRLTEDKSMSSAAQERFSDFDEVSEWAVDAVLWMAERSIIDGRDNGTFDPDAMITRAEAAKLLSGYIYTEY